MISTRIDGSASNQLFDLLAIVANPDVYTAKLKELQDATEQNRLYVEALGPASEIVALRDKAAELKDEADKALAKAQADAETIKTDASEKAKTLIDEANKTLEDAKVQAAEILGQASVKMAQAQELIAEAEEASKVAKKAQDKADEDAVNAAQAQAKADQAQVDAEQTKASIIAKHQAFIASL